MSVGNERRQGITLCTRNWKKPKPNPAARQSLQVTMKAASQRFSTRADFKAYFTYFVKIRLSRRGRPRESTDELFQKK